MTWQNENNVPDGLSNFNKTGLCSISWNMACMIKPLSFYIYCDNHAEILLHTKGNTIFSL